MSTTRYFDDKLQAWVTVCPPGKALGAGDMENWSKRRMRGLAGSDGIAELKEEAEWNGKRPAKGSKKRKFKGSCADAHARKVRRWKAKWRKGK